MSLNHGVPGGTGFDHRIKDAVDGLFMKGIIVTERKKKKFQRLALNAQLVGDIPQDNVPEVGLICHRAERGEFGTVELDFVVPVGIHIVKNLKSRLIGGLGITALRG